MNFPRLRLSHLAALRTWCHSAIVRENGNSTIEFTILMPLVMAIFLASFESSVTMMRKTMLDHALEATVRELRLGQIANPTLADLRTRICNRMAMVDNCTANLTVELNRRDTSLSTGITLPSLTAGCIDRATDAIEPVLEFEPGAANDLVLVRVCLTQDIIFASTEVALSESDPDSQVYHLISTSAYVNEPR